MERSEDIASEPLGWACRGKTTDVRKRVKPLFQNPNNGCSKESVKKILHLDEAKEDPSFQFLTAEDAVGCRLQ